MRKNILDTLRTLSVNVTVARAGFGYVIEVKHRDGSASSFRFFNRDERVLIGCALMVIAILAGMIWLAISR